MITKLSPFSNTAPPPAGGHALERHFKPDELGKLWGLSSNVIRDLFADEPGVLKIDHPETLNKRRYVSLRIPATVAERVHMRLQAKRKAA